MIKALILDDEFGAIKKLKWSLKDYGPEVEVLGFATSTKEAELKIKLLRPDVLFLDIEMQTESGIEFLKRLNYYDFEVVFITAYHEFAIQAFKLNALDYLLKPLDINELKRCISRLNEVQLLKENYKNWLTKERIENLNTHPEINIETNIILKSKEKVEIIPFKSIIYLQAEGTYTNFYFLQKGIQVKLMMSYPLAHYEGILPKREFLRVHKSYILNIEYIDHVIKDSGHYILTKTGSKIPISKRRVTSVLEHLKY